MIHLERQHGNDKRKAKIICPFYHRFAQDGRTIVCEGPEEKNELCMHFKRREDMDTFLECACNRYDYAKRCPIADMLWKAAQ